MKTAKMQWINLLYELALLDAVGLLLVGLLSLLGGASSYYEEIEASRASLPDYIASLIVYASLVELSLRGLQSRLSRSFSVQVSLITPAVLYGALHLHHSLVGALYALLLGLFVAWRFSLRERLGLFILWHIQWDLGALTFALFV